MSEPRLSLESYSSKKNCNSFEKKMFCIRVVNKIVTDFPFWLYIPINLVSCAVLVKLQKTTLATGILAVRVSFDSNGLECILRFSFGFGVRFWVVVFLSFYYKT